MLTLVQMFSLREFPLDEQLDRIAKLGFDGVEGFFGNFDNPAGFRAKLDACGLTMPQAHVPLALMEDEFDKAVSIARTLGITTLIGPWLPPEERPTEATGWTALGRRLNALEGRLRALGLRLAWHNHDFELTPLADGQTGMDILLAQAPGMDWQADLGWVIRAGQDPLDWITRHGHRIIAVHLKDRAPAGTEAEGGWADLGHGITDYRPIFDALRRLPRLSAHVAEHDNPNDAARFLSRWKVAHERLVAYRPGQVFDGYAHAAVMCLDMEAQVAFYRDRLGMEEMFRMDLGGNRHITYMRLTNGQFFELFSWGQGARAAGESAPGYHHVCFEVSDLDATVAALRANGLRLCKWAEDGSGLYETDENPISTGADHNRQAWFRDPEGNRIELMEMARDCLQLQAAARMRVTL